MDEGIPRLLLEGRPGVGRTTVATRVTRGALPEQLMGCLAGAHQGEGE